MKQTRIGLVALTVTMLLSAGVLIHGLTTLQAPATGTWAPTPGSMAAPRAGASAVLLSDGRILITGGTGAAGSLASAEFLNADGTFSAAPSMNFARAGHTATVLADGRVLVAGGADASGSLQTAELYDPSASTWTAAGPMMAPRSGHTATLLQNGTVLVAGGSANGAALNSLELFDPSQNTFAPAAATLSTARQSHAATVLSDGRVLIVGGWDGTTVAPVFPATTGNPNVLASSDIYDPVAGTVTPGPAMSTPRMNFTATVQLDGNVAAIGGTDGQSDLASIEVFDPAAGSFALGGSLTTARSGHLAFLLPHNNNVLIVGGTSGGAAVSGAELYCPWTGVSSATGSMSSARAGAVGSALFQTVQGSAVGIDGALVVAGGSDGTNSLSTAEVYGFATVKSDKADYAPGEIVTITGSGWQPGETVTLSLIESTYYDTPGPFTAVADANGNISNSEFSPDQYDVDVRFYLTASGSVSQAQTAFTDAKPSSVSVGAQTPNPIAPGGSAAYGVTIRFNGNGTNCTVNLSVTTALPTGATASFSPSSSPTSSGTADLLSTLNIATTGATPPGSTAFTVQAAGTGAACLGNNASGTGTLVVVEPTMTTLGSSLNPSTYGQSVTLTATVAQTSGPTTPTGTVTFKDGATTLGTGTLNGAGVATVLTSALTATGSPHSLTASYAGVANTFGASTSNTVSQVVDQRPITVTAATDTKTYDGTTSAAAAPTISSGTLAGTDTANFTETYDNKNGGSGKTLTPSGTVKNGANDVTANYTITFTPVATGVISARAITVTAAANSKTYDGGTTAAAVPTITSGSLATGDSSAFTETYDNRNVGTSKTMTPAGSVTDGNAGANYTVTFATSTNGTITARALTVTGATNTKTYDGTTSAAATPTITSGALQDSDTANFTEVYNNKNAGSGNKTLIPSGTVSDGNSGLNYTYAFVNFTTGTITARALTVTAVTNTKTYDGTTSAAATPSITSGTVQSGDTPNFTEAYNDKNAGAGNKTLIPAGTVTDGNSGNNYSYTFVNFTTGTINPLAITVTAAPNTKTYDGTTSAAAKPTITTGALQDSDTANFTETYDTANVGTNKTLTPSGTVSDGNSGNDYTYTFVTNTTGVINAKTVTASVTANNKPYDGNNTATIATCTLAGVVAGDVPNVTCAAAGATFVDKSVANGKTVTATGITLSGTAAGNYTLNGVTTATTTANITAATVTPSITADNKPYDGTTAATIATRTLAGVIAPDVVNLTGGTATFADANVGTGKTVTATGLSLTGADAGNYVLSSTTATTTADITKLTPTFSGLTASQSIPYGTPSIGLGGRVVGYDFMPGTVTINIDGVTSAPLTTNGNPNNFSTTFDTHAIAAGPHTITYTYSGDANAFGASDTSTTLTVTRVTPTVTWANPAAIIYGTALSGTQLNATFTAPFNGGTVTVAGAPTYNPLSGTVLNAGAGQTLSVSFVPTDTTDYNNASGSALITVTKAATSTAIASNNNPSFSGQSVTFTATVSNTSGTSAVPTGSVQFMDGASPLGSPQAVNGSGVATLTTSALSVATHSITAVYSNSDGNFTGSTSSALSQVVNSATTITVVASNNNPSIFGQPVMFTATVTSAGGTPTGTVQFNIDGNPSGSPNTLLGGVAQMSPSSLSPGTHSVEADYTPDVNFLPSSGTLGGGQMVYLAPSIPSDASTTIAAGAAGTFTVTAMGFPIPSLSDGGATLPGSVAFTPNPDGTATLAGTALVAGSYPFTITAHNGVGGDATQSFTLIVSAGAFTKLQLLVPGEAAAPGTVSGKTGTPDPEAVNGPFNVTVNAVDDNWNVVNSVTDQVQISSNDAQAHLPADAALVAGTKMFSVTLESVSYNPATTTLTASDTSDNTMTADTSPAIEVIKVYTASITPDKEASGDSVPYTLIVKNEPAPNTKTLNSVTVAIPTDAQGTSPSGISVTATKADHSVANWTLDSLTTGLMSFKATSDPDGVDPGGTITIQFTATTDPTFGSSPVAEEWTTTAFSNADYTGQLPLAESEPTVNIGRKPTFTSNDHVTFTVGIDGTFDVTTTDGITTPTVAETGSLPSGVSFTDNGDGTAKLTGTPAAGTAGIYALTLTAHNGYGADVTQSFTLTVGKQDQTITFNALSDETYGDPDFNVSATATSPLTVTFTASGNCTVTGTLVHITAAGSCTITAQQAGDGTYNAAPDVPQAFNIKRKDATWTTNPNSKTYGDPDPNPLTTGSGTGFLAADNVTAAYSRATGETVLGGPYLITAALSPAGVLGNYNISNNGANFTINARPATWTTNPNSKTYGDSDANPLTAGSGTGFLAADNVTASYSRAAGETVLGGPYHITATLSPGAVLSNYIITNAGADFTINARPATWTTNPNSKTYGDSEPNPLTTGSGTNFVAADNVTASYSRAAGETVLGSPYHITATLSPIAALSNYIITNAGADFTINARPATWTTNPNSKTYGDSEPNPLTTGSGTNFVVADNVTASYSRAAGETVVGGPYHITATLSPTAVLSNYIITNAGADFTINARPATWTTNPNSKTYGDSDPNPLTSGNGSFLAADNVTASYSRADGETVVGGPYHVTATLSPVNVLSNYIITNAGASFTINARPATWTTSPNSKTYGDSDPNPLTSGSGSGFLVSDGVTATYSRAAGETVLGSPYHITATLSPGGVLSNYIITNAGADFTISARPATWTTSPNSKTYGDSDPNPLTSGSGSGFLVSDGVTATYSRVAGETVLGGPYHITATLSPTAVISNYIITNAGASFTINQRPITVTPVLGQFKVYGNPDPPLTFLYTNGPLVSGDGFSGSLARVPGETVGSYLILQGTLGLSSNYNLIFTPGVTFSIVKTASSTTLISDSTPSGLLGAPITFTATVAPIVAPPYPANATGTVTFKDGLTTICNTVAIVGNTAKATCIASSLALGSHSISATYSGDGNFLGSSTASALSQNIVSSATIKLQAALHSMDSDDDKPQSEKTPLQIAITDLKVFDIAALQAKGISLAAVNYSAIWNGTAVTYPPNQANPPALAPPADSISLDPASPFRIGGGSANVYTIILPPFLGKNTPNAFGTSGSYLIIGKATIPTFQRGHGHDPIPLGPMVVYPGTQTGTLKPGDVTRKYHMVIQNASGKLRCADTDEVEGTLLLIVQPSYIEFTSDTEVVPVVYDSVDGDWAAVIDVAPPEGFVAVDPELTTAATTGTLDASQFVINDVGSSWTTTTFTHNLTHKGKKIKVQMSKPMVNHKGGNGKGNGNGNP